MSEDDASDDDLSYNTSNDILVLPSRRPKRPRQEKPVEVFEDDVRNQLTISRRKKRRLRQLAEQRARAELRESSLKRLKEAQLSTSQLQLLRRAGDLGQTDTRRQRLRRLLRKERAGLKLDEDEKKDLYEVEDDESARKRASDAPFPEETSGFLAKAQDSESSDDEITAESAREGSDPELLSSKRKGEDRRLQVDDEKDSTEKRRAKGQVDNGTKSVVHNIMADIAKIRDRQRPSKFASKVPESKFGSEGKTASLKDDASVEKIGEGAAQTEESSSSAFLPVEIDASWVGREASEEVKRAAAEAAWERMKNLPAYALRREEITRPAAIQDSRILLPVVSMEMEIMDAVHNNDFVVLCGETGSGKSTQVPQFLVEAGYCREGKYLVGSTQPRRVAAISTANRIEEEMGGDSSLHSRCRKVIYAVRYEVQKPGPDTRIKVMTDGILLQELKSDFLLRRYSCIVLDEAHERNLNTDILIGILSRCVPLRRRMFREGLSMIEGAKTDAERENAMTQLVSPLKVIVMSATLRVKEFAENSRLFPSADTPCPPVVTVDARQYPVTIHHSKRTELERYLDVAFNKVMSIHRKLPAGGILVFLTGRRDIEHMVKRLDQAINSKPKPSKRTEAEQDNTPNSEEAVREDGRSAVLQAWSREDDEEIDLDLERQDEYEELERLEDEDEDALAEDSVGRPSATSPALIFPLYAMLDKRRQRQIFQEAQKRDEEEESELPRLIVVATNVAETSITIPGIKYVVDPGRAKRRVESCGSQERSLAGAVSSYEVGWISQASAKQRAGRAGRTGPGHCYRLYSSAVFGNTFKDFDTPEIETRSLTNVVLMLKCLGIRETQKFPFVSDPPQGHVVQAVQTLEWLGAIQVDMKSLVAARRAGISAEAITGVTDLGQAMTRFPVDARAARMLVAGIGHGEDLLLYVIAAVAVLSEGNPFTPLEISSTDTIQSKESGEVPRGSEEGGTKQSIERIRESRRPFVDSTSDVLTRLKATGAFLYATMSSRQKGSKRQKSDHSKATALQFCRDHGLHLNSLNRIRSLIMQLMVVVERACGVGIKVPEITQLLPPTPSQEAKLRSVIAAGLVENVAKRLSSASALAFVPSMVERALELRSLHKDGDNSADAKPDLDPQELKRRYTKSITSSVVYVAMTGSELQPLFVHPNSFLQTSHKNEYVCFDALVQGGGKAPKTYMTCVTAIDEEMLYAAAKHSSLLKQGTPLATSTPRYDSQIGQVTCAVRPRIGPNDWILEPTRVSMREAHQNVLREIFHEEILRITGFSEDASLQQSDMLEDASLDVLRSRVQKQREKHDELEEKWFARFILEGKVAKCFSPVFKKGFYLLKPSRIVSSAPPRALTSFLLRVRRLREGAGDMYAMSRERLALEWSRDPAFLRSETLQLLQRERRKQVETAWPKLIERELARGI